MARCFSSQCLSQRAFQILFASNLNEDTAVFQIRLKFILEHLELLLTKETKEGLDTEFQMYLMGASVILVCVCMSVTQERLRKSRQDTVRIIRNLPVKEANMYGEASAVSYSFQKVLNACF